MQDVFHLTQSVHLSSRVSKVEPQEQNPVRDNSAQVAAPQSLGSPVSAVKPAQWGKNSAASYDNKSNGQSDVQSAVQDIAMGDGQDYCCLEMAPESGPEPTPSLAAHLEAQLRGNAATRRLELEMGQEAAVGAASVGRNGLEPFSSEMPHIKLTDTFCPDPLLMMNHLGEALAGLPEALSGDRPQRVSFSGGCHGEDSASWIGFIDVDAFASPEQEASGRSRSLTQPWQTLRSPQDYERFITEESSWFTPKVKENSRLHAFAKTTQRKRIADTAKLLALTLTADEALLDVLPVRYRRHTGSLIVTNQRLWCACESLRLQRLSIQDLALPFSELKRLEIADNGLRLRDQQREHCIYFGSSAAQNLEILLFYFVPVVRREIIPEISSQRINPMLGAGLVASILLGVGWTVSGFTDFLIDQVPQEPLQAQSRESLGGAGNLSSGDTSAPVVAVQPAQAHQRCVEQLNAAMHPAGYVALNRNTKTLRVHLDPLTGRNAGVAVGSGLNGVEFDAAAAAIANQVFSACDQASVAQVRIEDGRYSFLKGRFTPQSLNPKALVERSFSR